MQRDPKETPSFEVREKREEITYFKYEKRKRALRCFYSPLARQSQSHNVNVKAKIKVHSSNSKF